MFLSQRLLACPALLKVTSAKPLMKGASGPPVVVVQDLLSDLGFKLPNSRLNRGWDGIFGNETDKAVRGFQSGNGLKADGMIGPMTLGAFDRLICGNLMLELLDIGLYKAHQAFDAGAPAHLRRNAYW
jgi:peptidoglycan hydrolase-like protein with peptidoglycan-binding domain